MNENEKPMASGEPVPPPPLPVEEKHECGPDCQHEHIRGERTHAVVVDDAADFHSDPKANEGGDYFPPPGTSGPAEVNETGANGGETSSAGYTGSTGSTKPHSFSPRAARRNIHRLRHRTGRMTAAPGLAVICPIGSQLRAQKRVGPNDKCPCGSGKKYKKCCLNKSS